MRFAFGEGCLNMCFLSWTSDVYGHPQVASSEKCVLFIEYLWVLFLVWTCNYTDMCFFIGLPPLPAVLKEVRAADPLTSGSGKGPGGSWVGLDPGDQIYGFQFPSFPICGCNSRNKPPSRATRCQDKMGKFMIHMFTLKEHTRTQFGFFFKYNPWIFVITQWLDQSPPRSGTPPLSSVPAYHGCGPSVKGAMESFSMNLTAAETTCVSPDETLVNINFSGDHHLK